MDPVPDYHIASAQSVDEDPPVLAWSIIQNVVEEIFNMRAVHTFYEELYRFDSLLH